MKRLLYGLLLCLLLATVAAPAMAAPGVSMSAQAAFGGRTRAGAGWTTVYVDLANDGAELSADLVLKSGGGPFNNFLEYTVPLTLPAGAKKRVPVDVAYQGGGSIDVVLRSGGKVLKQETVRLSTINPESLFVGVLSDDELGVPGLSLMGAGKTTAPTVARLDAATFPARAPLLQDFDVIAISRFDASALTKPQLQALETWVGQGGTLLLSGGPEWSRTLKPLPPSLLPVSVTDVQDADLQSLGALAATPIAGKAPVSVATVLRGRTVAAAGDIPLLVEASVGAGKVIYQAFDPGLEPVVRWAGQPIIYERLVAPNHQVDNIDNGNTIGAIQSALQRIPGLGLPSPAVLGGLLAGYLLLVGPLNYFVLKRFDRREWSWVTVPLLSISFVGAIYGVGFSKQVTTLSHVITVTELTPGTQTGTMTAYLGLYAPSRNQVEVALESDGLVQPMWVRFGPDSPDGELTARVVSGDKTRVELLNLNNYSMKGFSVTRDIAAPGSLEFTQVSIENGRVLARVVNKLDRPIQDVLVSAGGGWTNVGTLAPGATSDPVSIDLTVTDPKMRGGMPFDAIRVQGPGIINQDVIYEQERRNNILSGVWGWDGSQMKPGTIVVAGWTTDPVAATGMPQLGRQVNSSNFVYTQWPIYVDAASGEIPPGLIVGVHTGGSGFGRTPRGYTLARGAHTMSLTVPPLDPAKVAAVKLHLNIFGMDGGYTVQARNQSTGDWVTLEDMTVQTLPNWQQLLGNNGVLELKFDVTSHLEMAAPTISVEGVGQ